MENNNEGGFQYTYSAKEQEEVKRIRERYLPATEREDKLERLRRLDAGVAKKAQAVSLTLGVVGILILGLGMSLCMTDLGAFLGALRDLAILIGVVIGIVGGLLTSLAYPVYQQILRRERKRIAPEILLLTEELMK